LRRYNMAQVIAEAKVKLEESEDAKKKQVEAGK
jgi:hypothetical protein